MPRPTGFADEATCWIRTGCETALPLPTRAWHAAVLPPFEPAHVHIHGPVPVTADAAPVLQRLAAAGLLVRPVPLTEPHTPLTSVFCAFADPLVITANSSRNIAPRIKFIAFSGWYSGHQHRSSAALTSVSWLREWGPSIVPRFRRVRVELRRAGRIDPGPGVSLPRAKERRLLRQIQRVRQGVSAAGPINGIG